MERGGGQLMGVLLGEYTLGSGVPAIPMSVIEWGVRALFGVSSLPVPGDVSRGAADLARDPGRGQLKDGVPGFGEPTISLGLMDSGSGQIAPDRGDPSLRVVGAGPAGGRPWSAFSSIFTGSASGIYKQRHIITVAVIYSYF